MTFQTKIDLPNLLTILILFAFFSCSKEKSLDEENLSNINDVTGVTISISDINTTDINTDVKYQFSGVNDNDVITKILYRTLENSSYQEAEEGVLTGLESGKKYLIKGVVEINGSKKESEEISITTLGFHSDNLRGELLNYDGNSHSAYDDRKYSIYNSSAKSDFEIAPELIGYFKVGNDSILLESIEVQSKNELIVTIPADSQNFFDNDTEYNIKKEFTIGLFSGDYYKEIVESRNTRSINFWIDDTNHFTIYNKVPFIEDVRSFENSTCEGIEKIQFSIIGGFGGMPDTLIERRPENMYTSISITISKDNNILSVLDYDSLKLPGESYDCTIEQYQTFVGVSGNLTSMELTFNSIRVNLEASTYSSGNYSIEFKGIGFDDTSWNSNVFNFTIE